MLPSPGRRRVALALVASLAAVLSCHEPPTVPSRLLAPENATHDAATDAAEMAPADASASVSLGERQFLGHYPRNTRVLAHVTGSTTLTDGIDTWTYGIGGHPYAGGRVGFAIGTDLPGGLDVGNATEWSDTISVQGDIALVQQGQGIFVGEDGRPWTMTGHATATLRRLDATLGLGDGFSHDAPYTMTEMKAVEGQHVLLLPRALEGPSYPAAVDPKTWLFAADSGGPPTPACVIPQRTSCQMIVPEAGTVTVTGYANSGPPTTASIHFTVPTSRVELHLSRDSVASGDTVFVTTTIIDAQTDATIDGYEYDAPEWVSGTCVTGYGAGLSSCYIVLTGPGTLTVYATMDGRQKSAAGSIKVTEPAPDGPPLAITIVQAEGPNPNKSFTFDPAERKITLKAQVTPATASAIVTWEVIDAPDDNVSAIPPTEALTGLESSFLLPKHDKARWPTDHPGTMDRKTLRYKVTAIATSGGRTARSGPVIVSQDLVDTIREEYYEFGLTVIGRHIPGRGEFASVSPGDPGMNPGDYPLAVLEPKFMNKLADLESAWPGRFQVNAIYRNPNHNLNKHIRSKSPPSRVTWHMWGCAADLQTFPADGSEQQKDFFKELRNLAEEVGFQTEAMDQSLPGHVHVELDCP